MSIFTHEIKGILFDVDNTLYRVPQPQYLAVDGFFHDLAAKAVGWNVTDEQLRKNFAALKDKLKSAILAIQSLTGMTPEEIAVMMDKEIAPYWQSIQPDPDLTIFFNILKEKNYFLGTLRNGTVDGTVEILTRLLGVKVEPISARQSIERDEISRKELVRHIGPLTVFPTAEIGFVKPQLEPFNNVIRYTGIPHENWLMVGNKFDKDLKPARSLGMEIVLVDPTVPEPFWSNDTNCFIIPTCTKIATLLNLN